MIQTVLSIISYTLTRILSALDDMMINQDVSYLDYIMLISIFLLVIGFIINIIPKAHSGNTFKFFGGGKGK